MCHDGRYAGQEQGWTVLMLPARTAPIHGVEATFRHEKEPIGEGRGRPQDLREDEGIGHSAGANSSRSHGAAGHAFAVRTRYTLRGGKIVRVEMFQDCESALRAAGAERRYR